MTTSLETRIRRLEDATGADGECPRCSGTTVILVNGKVAGVSKYRRKLPLPEAEAFVVEEEAGRCPLCGAVRQTITVGGWGDLDP
jgi:Zn finger protein HypA/HybF involved in hydrogenase expression